VNRKPPPSSRTKGESLRGTTSVHRSQIGPVRSPSPQSQGHRYIGLTRAALLPVVGPIGPMMDFCGGRPGDIRQPALWGLSAGGLTFSASNWTAYSSRRIAILLLGHYSRAGKPWSIGRPGGCIPFQEAGGRAFHARPPASTKRTCPQDGIHPSGRGRPSTSLPSPTE
jgi:hypothetical protein